MSMDSNALPQQFLKRMCSLLGPEYAAFLDCYEKPHFRGIRLNPLKCSLETLEQGLDFPLKPSPFSPLSFYIPQETEKLGFLPFHHGGAFYVQEPSASSAVTALDPQPGDRVLDLCAAPGGKSTQIAALLQGKGLLWSNEVVRSRVSILLSNMERMGVGNGVVSSCRPDRLCDGLAGFFDRVLVDAPCSGEGMFRRDRQAVDEWSEEHVKACAARQLAILDSAAQAVRQNGVLVYSTCTFSKEENEDTVTAFLTQHPEFALEDTGCTFGRPGIGMVQTRRIFPMDGGEGHFVARLRRTGENSRFPVEYTVSKSFDPKPGEALYRELIQTPLTARLEQAGDTILLLPDGLPEIRGLGVVRAGVPLGELKSGRVEPAHGLYASAFGEFKQVVDFSSHSEDIRKFLHGEELDIPEEYKGFTGVSVDGVMTGFGKASGGRLKNRYPKGLRNH